MSAQSSYRDTATTSAFPHWLGEARDDVRYAWRQNRRTPGVTLLIVTILGVGIGANVTMAGAIDRLLLRAPPHVREPDRVGRLLFATSNAPGGQHVSARTNYPTFLDLQREVSSFESVGVYWSTQLFYGDVANAQRTRASFVSGSFFSVFGVNAIHGRLFSSDGDSDSRGAQIAVLGYGFWQTNFGGARNVVGQPIQIGKLTYTVVGIAPKGFRGVEFHAPDVWLPIAIGPERATGLALSLEDRGAVWLSIVAKLKAGVENDAAANQATNVLAPYDAPRSFRGETQRRVVIASVVPGRGPDRPREVNVVLWLGGVAALVLLIACANVANLLLTRSLTRRSEIAIRLAVGASRARLVRQMLSEGLLLATVGGIAALFLATLGTRILGRLLQDSTSVGLPDVRDFFTAAAIVLGTGMLIGLAPLYQTASSNIISDLRTGGVAKGRQRSPIRNLLVATQAAVCVMLLIGAGLFSQSLRRIEALDLGVDIDRTIMAKADFSGGGGMPRAEIDAAYATILERIRRINGVSYAALAESDPYTYGRAVSPHTPEQSAETFWHEGVPEVPLETAVDSGFFRAVGATSLRGRDFEATDRRGSPLVAIINEPLAKLLWPGRDPIGKCMLLSTESNNCFTVVGVTRGFWKSSILVRARFVVYTPIAQSTAYIGASRSIFVAANRKTAGVITQVREAIQGSRQDIRDVSVLRMRDIIDPEIKPWRLASTMFTVFGGIALLIAIAGLYGVVAFTVTQRSREIAIRIALGARMRHVLSLVALESLGAVAAGLVTGVLIALYVGRWITPLLFQTSPIDTRIIGLATTALLSVAVVASVLPTLSVFQRDPTSFLRVE